MRNLTFFAVLILSASAQGQVPEGPAESVAPAAATAPPTPGDAPPAVAPPTPTASSDAAAEASDTSSDASDTSSDASDTSSDASDTSSDADDTSSDPSTSYDGFSVPDVPALAVMDATGIDVDRPSTPGELSVALKSLYGSDGLTPGVGLEITPKLFGGVFADSANAGEYRDKYWSAAQVVSRFALSIATQETSSTADATAGEAADEEVAASNGQLAVGYRWVIVDGADPYYDPSYWRAVAMAREECRDVDPMSEEWATCRAEAYKASVAKASHWTDFGFALAGATSWVLPERKFKDLKMEKTAGWAVAAVPLAEDRVQLAGGATYSYEKLNSVHALTVSARLRFGGEKLKGALDGAVTTDFDSDVDKETEVTGALTVEYQVIPEFTLQGGAKYSSEEGFTLEVASLKIASL